MSEAITLPKELHPKAALLPPSPHPFGYEAVRFYRFSLGRQRVPLPDDHPASQAFQALQQTYAQRGTAYFQHVTEELHSLDTRDFPGKVRRLFPDNQDWGTWLTEAPPETFRRVLTWNCAFFQTENRRAQTHFRRIGRQTLKALQAAKNDGALSPQTTTALSKAATYWRGRAIVADIFDGTIAAGALGYTHPTLKGKHIQQDPCQPSVYVHERFHTAGGFKHLALNEGAAQLFAWIVQGYAPWPGLPPSSFYDRTYVPLVNALNLAADLSIGDMADMFIGSDRAANQAAYLDRIAARTKKDLGRRALRHFNHAGVQHLKAAAEDHGLTIRTVDQDGYPQDLVLQALEFAAEDTIGLISA